MHANSFDRWNPLSSVLTLRLNLLKSEDIKSVKSDDSLRRTHNIVENLSFYENLIGICDACLSDAFAFKQRYSVIQ